MMKINYEYIKEISSKINLEDNFIKRIKNGIYLKEKEILVLDNYNIDYNSCTSLSDIIYKIEERLYNEYSEELEKVSYELSERNYYQNTNK